MLGQIANWLPKPRLSEREILNLIIEKYSKELDECMAFLQHFLNLHKNSNYSFLDLKKRLVNCEDRFEEHRATLFLTLYQYVAGAYGAYLNERHKYDFADMINAATQAVREIPECAHSYRYILVDEVQDLSPNRQILIRAILDKNPGCRLFAVGDDWQSIYRFTGSDPSLISNFARVFGGCTRKSYIETTHRFGKTTAKVSSKFMRKNPFQTNKKVHSVAKNDTPIKIILSSQSGDDSVALERIISSLICEYGERCLREKKLQIISRYNHDVSRIQSEAFVKLPNSDGTFRVIWHDWLEFEYCSMHKSKGITRDIVIVLNMNSTPFGMPATRENDPLIDALLAPEEKYPFAEERRLFYVAITRAREQTFLVAERRRPSPFLFEIDPELDDLYRKLCPKCQCGELIRKNTPRGAFETCSNWKYGCNYVAKVKY